MGINNNGSVFGIEFACILSLLYEVGSILRFATVAVLILAIISTVVLNLFIIPLDFDSFL